MPRMAHLVELRPLAPRAGHSQVHVVGQLPQFVDVGVQLVRQPPRMAGRLGHGAAVEVSVGIEPGSEGLVDGLHVRDGLAAGGLGRADRGNRVVEVAVAALAVADDQVGSGKPSVLPDHRLGVVEVEDQPAHEAGPIDLHVGVANGVFARPDAGGRLVVRATRQIGRFREHAVERGARLEKAVCCLVV